MDGGAPTPKESDPLRIRSGASPCVMMGLGSRAYTVAAAGEAAGTRSAKDYSSLVTKALGFIVLLSVTRAGGRSHRPVCPVPQVRRPPRRGTSGPPNRAHHPSRSRGPPMVPLPLRRLRPTFLFLPRPSPLSKCGYGTVSAGVVCSALYAMVVVPMDSLRTMQDWDPDTASWPCGRSCQRSPTLEEIYPS